MSKPPSKFADLEMLLLVERKECVAAINKFTPRERVVATLIWAERSDKEIMNILGIGKSTLREHISNLCRKLRKQTRIGIALGFERALHKDSADIGTWLNQYPYLRPE